MLTRHRLYVLPPRCAFVTGVACFVVALFEFGARLSESQILISPDGALAPYEYMSLSLHSISTGKE